MELYLFLSLAQFVFTFIIALYFFIMLKGQRNQKAALGNEGKEELEKLKKLRAIKLTEPLTEKTRPVKFEDIIGQEDGIRALKAALCGKNPQHVLIYGPPGVGKTAASRLVLEYAKQQLESPFTKEGKFIEMDATLARFDERGIADPLIGSVHDPIYQGAGAYGQAGVPHPKKGAVTDANGGVLFIDEIGELHKIQANKLLKVLEDRKVMFESAYYSKTSTVIPEYIHDIFQNGMPADFRLIGATTRQPHEISPALRSRCVEIFFKELEPEELKQIAKHAADKIGCLVQEEVYQEMISYVTNGREMVNLVQLAAGVAADEGRNQITEKDLQWIVRSGRLEAMPEKKAGTEKRVGCVYGLGVTHAMRGMLLNIEISTRQQRKKSEIRVTGMIEEEIFRQAEKEMKRKSLAVAAVENILTYFQHSGMITDHYTIHINFPGGIPVDGPSAGLALTVGIYASITKQAVSGKVAFTGEVGIHGHILPVGGVREKLRAAKRAGIEQVFIPKENFHSTFQEIQSSNFHIIPVVHVQDVLNSLFVLPAYRTDSSKSNCSKQIWSHILSDEESSAG